MHVLRARRQGNLPQTVGPFVAEDRLRVDENTKEELVELVIEMFERFDRIHVETHDDLARQQRFFNLIGPEHSRNMAASRACSRFLVRHEDLLGP